MLNRVLKLTLTLVGVITGLLLVYSIDLSRLISASNYLPKPLIYALGGLVGGVVFFLLSSFILSKIGDVIKKAEKELELVPTKNIVFGSLGLILGLIIAYFISQIIKEIPPIPIFGEVLAFILTIFTYIIFAYLGVRLALRTVDDFENYTLEKLKSVEEEELVEKSGFFKRKSTKSLKPKILDTSVIIDGRIQGIIEAGFIEGTIIIPNFVLHELQKIADSSDSLRRTKGRRGLDILNDFQSSSDIDVQIYNEDFEDIKEVDSKLLKLAQVTGGKVLTNDYNLNKVAGVRGIEVLNINELANALKPVVVHGESMNLYVLKEGKEEGQGLAYLDDGTMIVIEDGKDYIGENIDITVTSVLQTSAGKMIFAKLAN